MGHFHHVYCIKRKSKWEKKASRKRENADTGKKGAQKVKGNSTVEISAYQSRTVLPSSFGFLLIYSTGFL